MKNQTYSPAPGAPEGSDPTLKPYFRYAFERIADIVLILEPDGTVREANPSFERLYGYTLQEIQGMSFQNLIRKEELSNFVILFSQALQLPGQKITFDLRMRGKEGEQRDLTGGMTNLVADPAVGGVLLIASDTTEQRRWESILGQYSHRLEVLRKIQSGLLLAESPEKISRVALDHIHSIIPCPMASITLFEQNNQMIHLLATLGGMQGSGSGGDSLEQIEEIQSVLKQGDWFEVEDVQAWVERSPLFQMLAMVGVRRVFFIPLLIRGSLIGSLNLGFLSDEVIRLDHLEAAREIADMLALAIQQSRLLEAEQRQRQQAELIRDAVASVPTSLNFRQIMADLLKSLRLLVTFDSARVVLIEEDMLHVAAASGFPDDLEVSGRRYSKEDRIFQKMLASHMPVVLYDAQKEEDFTPWEGQECTRAWMGVPLISHDGMIGYISVNSCQAGAFEQIDMAPILVFADHVSVTLENAWLYDETVRRAKELAAMARVSTALRTAKSLQGLMDTLIEKTLEAIEAKQGFAYRVQGEEMILASAVGPAKSRIGQRFAIGEDALFSILSETRSMVLGRDLNGDLVEAWVKERPYAANPRSFVFVPLLTPDGMVGLMCLDLEGAAAIDLDRRKIIESIADMASNALYRVMTMGELENRVADQTRDLTILFEISSITSQALDLKDMLSLSLDRLLSFTGNSLGVIYQIEANGSRLLRLAERRYPIDSQDLATAESTSSLPEVISLETTDFFSQPLNTGIPHVIPDIAAAPAAPTSLLLPDMAGYVGIPVKSKGHVLGMLCLFSRAVLNVSIEQITLLSAIGDQLGVALESGRLRQRAAEAALIEERQRLARDLHDSVTQSLYSLTLLAEGYRRQVPQGSLEQIQSWLEDLEGVSLQALKEMRLLLYELKPASFQEDGLVDALNRRLQSVESRSGMKINLKVDPRVAVPARYQENLYRIAQEALNNTLKHSGADAVEISLFRQGQELVLEILDNGKGFPVEEAFHAGGLGLTGMTERARNLGAEIKIQSTAETGTRIRIAIPGGSHE